MTRAGHGGLLRGAVLAAIAILVSLVLARLGVESGVARVLGVVLGIVGATALLVREDDE